MKTVKEVLNKSIDFLSEKGIAQPRRQAEELIGNALGLKRIDLYLEFDRPLMDAELERCRSTLSRRAKGEPQQYIRGSVDFLDCTIKVNRDVLIPRQETEILADMVAKSLEKENLTGKTLWDLCCGSGCIGVALKKRFPELNVVLSDASGEALIVAKENAKNNNADVTFLQGDLLKPFQGKTTDYLVCNPPYISEDEYQKIDKEVRDYEPRTALVAQEEGMAFYRRLAKELPNHLISGGKGWLEIGYNQGKSVQTLFSAPSWKKSELKKDWAGHDRFFFLEIE